MQQRYFLAAFGVSGDLTEVPTAIDPSGFVSYTQGFTVDYERPTDGSDPLSKDINRNNMNALLYDITLNLQNYQQWGFPEWITATDNSGASFAYGQYAIVRYEIAAGTLPFIPFMSLVANNTVTPVEGANWSRVANLKDITTAVAVETTRATAAEATKAPIASPTFTGVAAAPTPTAGTSTTQLATTAFVTSGISVETTRATAAETLLQPGRLLNTQLINSSGTYTPTAGTKSIVIELIGGGAAGGGTPTTGASQVSCAAGGGGGGSSTHRMTSGFSGLSIVIGAGGVGASGNVFGQNGGSTTMGGAVAGGGSGGASAGAAAFTLCIGGAGGVSSGGTVKNDTGDPGQIGQGVWNSNFYFGGAGGGPGGAPGTNGATGGANSVGHGGGGGGACASQNCTPLTGGSGSAGRVVIWEYT